MRNIGIATLHYGFNEGAILQAFSLAKLITQEISDTNVRILDHRYPDKIKIYGLADNERKLALQDSVNNWLPLDNNPFYSNHCKDTFEYIDKNYENLVVGSDVVWYLKYKRNLKRFFSPGLFPRQPYGFFPAFPNFYWPNNKVKVSKVSFAASVGMLEWYDIPRSHRKEMIDILSNFNYISVRDERSLHFLDWLSSDLGKNVEIVADPTLVVDLSLPDNITLDSLKTKLLNFGIDFNRPTCGIVSKDYPEVAKFCVQLRRENYQIIGITTKNSFCDINLWDKAFHPLEWAYLFKFFDFCIVDRMHPSIFCIKNKTSFIALDSYETINHNFSKIKSLMNRYGLGEYCLSIKSLNVAELYDKYSNIKFLNWSAQEKQMQTDKSNAINFIKKSLN